jgi:sortase B
MAGALVFSEQKRGHGLTAYKPKHRKEDGAKAAKTAKTAKTAQVAETAEAVDTVEAVSTAEDAEAPYRPLDAPARRRSRSSRSTGRSESSRRGERTASPRVSRFQLSLAVGIVLIVVALVIGVFLIYKYVNADRHNSALWDTSGLGVGLTHETVAPDASLDDLSINWDALREINPDIVGWLMIPDTRINYPIVQASDNDFYLNHLSDRTPSDAGAIFLDYENDPAIAGWNNLIYGHNLLDGSMFAALKSYSDPDFFDAHQTLLLATPAQNYRLEVKATLVCDADDRIRRFGFSDRADYEEYARMLLDYAVIDKYAEGEIPENLYCFATCTSADYSKRTMILASVAETRTPDGAVAVPAEDAVSTEGGESGEVA